MGMEELTRRNFLKVGSLAAAGVALPLIGCSPAASASSSASASAEEESTAYLDALRSSEILAAGNAGA